MYTECQHFGISVLSSEQGALSGEYAQRGGHSAQAEHFTTGPQGEPKLTDALAHFTCAAYAVHPGGDHQIIVGEVLQFESTIRSAKASAEKPPKTTECTAPIRAQANIAMAASGTIGI